MKKIIAQSVFIVILVGALAFNAFSINQKSNNPLTSPVISSQVQDPTATDAAEFAGEGPDSGKETSREASDVEKVEKLNQVPVQDIEKEIEKLESQLYLDEAAQKLKEEREANIEAFLKQMENGDITFRGLMSDTIVAGDSLMHGLNVYNILDKSNLVTKVSASLYHLSDNKAKIIAANPKNLIIHYGINMMVDSQAQLDRFINQYSGIVAELKTALPNTNIYISGVFNVTGSALSRFPCVAKYNAALVQMCQKYSINYLDNSSLLPGDGHYYGGDGIHVSASFYREKWLPYVCVELGL